MKNIRWNGWTILLAIVVVIFAIRVLARVFSWLWVLGSALFNILVWVAAVALVVYLLHYVYNRVRRK